MKSRPPVDPIALIRHVLGFGDDKVITGTTRLREDLGATQANVLEMKLTAQQDFDITISTNLADIITAGHFVDAVMRGFRETTR